MFPSHLCGENNGDKRGEHKKLCTLTNNADLPHPGNYFVQQENRTGFFKAKSQLLTYRALVLIPVLHEITQCQSGGVWQCFVLLKFRSEGFWCFVGHEKGRNWSFRSAGLRQRGEIMVQVYRRTLQAQGLVRNSLCLWLLLLVAIHSLPFLDFLIKLSPVLSRAIRASQELLLSQFSTAGSALLLLQGPAAPPGCVLAPEVQK